MRRCDNPHDRRAKTLELTAEGRALVEGVERMLDSVRERLLQHVSAPDLAATLRVLEAIADATGETLPVPAPAQVQATSR